MQNRQKPKGLSNLIIILVLALIGIGLLVASRFIQSPNANLTQTEIDNTIKALATESPVPADTETTAMPERQPDETAPGYLFIILEGRVWGIEALGEEREVTVDQGSGVVNVIHLQKDGFFMESSTCDNQLCVGEGTVTLDNWQQRILGPCVYCLPHNLQLELVVPNAERDPNAPDA